MKDLISRLLERYPDVLSSKDLIELGLFSSICMAYRARKVGESPPYIKVGQKIMYPKEGVMEFMSEHIYSGKEKL